MYHPNRRHRHQNSSKISRQLWDKSREPEASYLSLFRAILYECQPIRVSSAKSILLSFLSSLSNAISSIPVACKNVLKLISHTPPQVLVIFACIAIYCYFVYYLHILFDAGPITLIVTALVIIFSVGLGDASRGNELSAYSVFNRGGRAIIGSLDADSLVAQHVGGAMANAGLGRLLGDTGHSNNQRNAAHRQQQPHTEADDQQVIQQRSRKSNKKSRRGNLETRIDRRRQREMATQMGFTGNGNEEDVMAMNRALENVNDVDD